MRHDHERDGGVEASLEVVSGVDVCAEQDFEACVLDTVQYI